MSRLRLAAILLLVAGAGLFAIGTTVEKNRDDHHDEPASNTRVVEPHGEGSETAEQRATETADGRSEPAESDEGRILGIDREATSLVVVAVLASLMLAAAIWTRPTRLVWIVAGLVTAAFAVFDLAEMLHQVDASQTGLALLAALVGLTHIGAAALSLAAVRLAPPTARP